MTAANRRVGSGRILSRGDRDEFERNSSRYEHRDQRGFGRDEDPRGDRGGGLRRNDRDLRGDPRGDPRKLDRWGDTNDRYDDDRFGRNRNTPGRPGDRRFDGRGMRDPRDDPRDFRDRRGPERGGGRYNNRRNEGEEPEWMSETIEQGEMMELRGFDDSPEKERQLRDEKKAGKKNAAKQILDDGDNDRRQDEDKARDGKPTAETTPAVPPTTAGPGADLGFNLDDILHMDSIPGLANILDDSTDIDPNDPDSSTGSAAPNAAPSGGGGGGSRFSQFFKRPQPAPQSLVQPQLPDLTQSAETAAAKEDPQPRKKENNSVPAVKIPSPTEANSARYFTPISPAAKTGEERQQQKQEQNSADQPNQSLLSFIKGGEQGTL